MALVAITCLATVAAVRPALAQSAPAPRASETAPPARLSLRVEFRERMESLQSIGFTGDRDDVFWLSRLRVSVAARPTSWLRTTVQVQDARVAGKAIGPTGTPFSAPLDLRIAQAELGPASSPLVVTLGRQELVFGEQRLVGHVNWANAARSFDAARVTFRRPGLRVDGFASSVVRIRGDEWDRGGFGNRFHGVYGSTTRVVPDATLEPYVLWREDRAGAGRSRLTTTGVRLAGRIAGRTDYDIESVVQRGTLERDDHRARAQHVRVRTPVRDHVRVVAEYNYASGDRTAGDGRRETFDPLYPTPHDKYGLADQIGWRNLHHARAAIDVTAVPLPVTVAYHSWWLASATDALYNTAGAAVARVPDGAPGRHVGQGLDIQTSRALTSRVQMAAGYGCVMPGAFLRAATPGARLHAVYVMATIAATVER